MNQIIRSGIISIVCGLLLAPPAAMAEQKWELAINGAALNFGYREFSDSGKLFDREHGTIPGLGMSLSLAQDQWLFAGDFSYHAGAVVYDGQTSAGVPISSHTNQKITDGSIRAEHWQSANYAWYLGAGYHYWTRDIQPSYSAAGTPASGLFEIYQWWLGFAGVKAVLIQSDRVHWLLDARLTRSLNPSITVDFNGQHDTARLSLGKRWGARLALPWRYKMDESTNMVVEPFAENFTLGRSATTPLTDGGVTAGIVYEPRSETLNYGLLVGINQRF